MSTNKSYANEETYTTTNDDQENDKDARNDYGDDEVGKKKAKSKPVQKERERPKGKRVRKGKYMKPVSKKGGTGITQQMHTTSMKRTLTI